MSKPFHPTKIFICRLIVFVLITVLLCSGGILLSSVSDMTNHAFSYITDSGDYIRFEEKTKEDLIQHAQQAPQTCTKLMVGDSVSYMLFTRIQNGNETYLFGGMNRPFTIAGQYVVVKEFLDAHPAATDVYMLESKDTLESFIDIQYGYQSVIAPMIATRTFKDLDANTRAEARQKFGPLLLNRGIEQIYDYSNMNRKIVLNLLRNHYADEIHGDYEVTDNQISPLAVQYLNNIIDLCHERNVKLHILHDPLADTAENHAALKTEAEMFQNAPLHDTSLGEAYIQSAIFYPPEDFMDGVHIRQDDALENTVIQDLIDRTGEMQDINLNVKPQKVL